MRSINSYIQEGLFDQSIGKHGLSQDDYEYRFKCLDHVGGNVVKKILIDKVKSYGKDPEEVAKWLKQQIELDELLVDRGFNRINRCDLVSPDPEERSINGVYFMKTRVNSKGYVVIFDPLMSSQYVPYSFLVCKAYSKVGKTLRPVEYVEPADWEKEIHQYDGFQSCDRTFYDDPKDAMKYIENKYGRF